MHYRMSTFTCHHSEQSSEPCTDLATHLASSRLDGDQEALSTTVATARGKSHKLGLFLEDRKDAG